MTKEDLKKIFIEEATEIIEQLDVKIIDFEEDPNNKDLLNDLFRGVHTLKGSSNSFGFTKLGEFVHHFEDLLDFHRNSDSTIDSSRIDLFLDGVDIIKGLFEYELGNKEIPENFEPTLKLIYQALDKKETEDEKPAEQEAEATSESNELKKFVIILHLDSDSYFRGFDHAVFFKGLSQIGRVVESNWDMKEVPTLEKFDPNELYIKDVLVIFEGAVSQDEIVEVFEFLEDYEYKIEPIEEKEEEPEAVVNVIKDEPNKVETKKKKDSKPSFVKIDTNKLDELFDSVGELVIAQNFLAENSLIKEIKDEKVTKSLETLFKITRLIQNRVMSLRMVPIKDTFDKMKRVFRDSTKKVQKEVELEIIGEDTEIDKTVVDSLSDPLIHIIRNAVDHGIEATAEDRAQAGKSKVAKVVLSAYHKGGNIAIEIRDDGRGVNRDKVLKKALERGLAQDDVEYTDSEVFNFIMMAGFSTADVISDISGRGVGLDVVATSIEKLSGKVEIESTQGKGTTFRILLPLTLAIIDGMLVKSSDETFIIPILSIIESFRPSREIVHTVKNKGEFVNLRGELLPVIRLSEKLELDDEHPNIWDSTLVCVENEKGKFTILIDDLIGRQQVVIKPLSKALSKLKEISGGAVMGNGEIALILNVESLY